MNLSELFTPAAIAAHWEEVASNMIPYLGTGLFPANKKAGLDLAWIKGSNGLPVSLMPSAFDAKATFREREGFKFTETEMPFFREGFKNKEKDRQELLRITEKGDPYLNEILSRLYKDSDNLIAGANVVPERMIMQLLFAEEGNVGISIKANGTTYVYNYDPDGAWKKTNYFALTGNAVWSNTENADPFSDIEEAQNAVSAKSGTTPTVAYMNKNTFNLLAKVDAVKNRFLSTAGITTGYVTSGDVKRLFEDTNEVALVVYDKQYRDEDRVAHKFVPDGYVALAPAGALGETWYGTTPEEADLRGRADASVSIVNTGVAVTQIIDPHPVNVNTFASEIVLPSYERMDEVAVLKVV